MDFTKTKTALDAHRLLFTVAQTLGAKPDFEHRVERVEWVRQHDEAAAAYQRVLDAYATELLPTIISPGPWRQARTGLRARPDGQRKTERIIDAYYALFDHGVTFRKQSGAKDWSCTVVIGQPYPKEGIEAVAANLSTKHPVAVWARDDLSAWFPGWTRFILAADRYYLKPEAAPGFGFQVLA